MPGASDGGGERPIAIVLVSGGMDSCVAAAIAAREHEPAFLHVSYGQRTEGRERRSFEAIADHYRVRRRLAARLDLLHAIGGSCLTDPSIAIPAADLTRADIPVSYVPFRNTHFLAAAVSWAEVIGATAIYIGAVEEDSSGYPDCRRVYYDAFNRLIEVGTRPGSPLRVVTPLIGMSKAGIVRLGLELGAPFELTWSCYGSEERACGACDSCALRLRGFAGALARDPIPYA
ncbi:MAG: 7-cyano-7-deazaguanine synthase QueC [Acidobacteria bacterium]|nr:7-cyano-7-deazaguanine synthase QueC [Acidobacteriota bacterium]